MKSEAKIIVIGDDNVGKTSIIAALVEERFVEEVPLVLSDVFIPAEIVSEGIPMYITDTSNRLENKSILEADIRKNDSIVLVYDVNNLDSFNRLQSYWVPYLQSLQLNNKPIVLVGNKIDTRGEFVINDELEENMVPLMNESSNIEVCVECSAKLNMNIADIFLYALKFAIYPTFPIYDVTEKRLKSRCVLGLTRIFSIFDCDADGFLEDDEFNQLHVSCFDMPIQAHEIEDMKSIIRDSVEMTGLPGAYYNLNHRDYSPPHGGISLPEFLSLHLHFIQRGRPETTWKVLRKFGYDDELLLADSYLHPRFDIPADCALELTSRANQFIIGLFKKFDRDQDGALSPAELETFMSQSEVSPVSSLSAADTPQNAFMDAAKRVMTNENGYLTLNGFLAQWHLLVLKDPRKAIEFLAVFGFQNPLSVAVTPTVSRKSELKKGHLTRNTVNCFVFGALGSGKSTLLKKFIKKIDSSSSGGFVSRNGSPVHGGGEDPAYRRRPPTSSASPSSQTPSGVGSEDQVVIRSVEWRHTEKYLVLEEIGGPHKLRSLLYAVGKDFLFQKADLVVLMYDSSDPNSFAYLGGLVKDLKLDNVPVVMLATKNDLGEAKQRYPIQPKDFCRAKHWLPPVEVSLTEDNLEGLYSHLIEVAMNPNTSVTHQVHSSLTKWIRWTAMASTCLAGAYISFLLYKKYKALAGGAGGAVSSTSLSSS